MAIPATTRRLGGQDTVNADERRVPVGVIENFWNDLLIDLLPHVVAGKVSSTGLEDQPGLHGDVRIARPSPCRDEVQFGIYTPFQVRHSTV